MAVQYPAANQPRRGRSPWFWVAIGVGGCLLLVVLACIALTLFGGTLGAAIFNRFGGDIGTSWADVAAQTDMQIYEPEYLPAGAGQPTIVSINPEETFQLATGQYQNGLSLTQSSENPAPEAQEPIDVEGADEAYSGTVQNDQGIVLRKGQTWIALAGAPQDELIRIAESLTPIEG